MMAAVVPCCAQTATDSVVTLDEVVAVGTRNLTPRQSISRQQLDAMAGGGVADALRYLAGVQVKDYGGLGGQKTVNVRSLGSQHVGVYIDGVRLTNVQNGTVDLGKYSLSTLDAVSLYNGNKTEPLMTASEYASAATLYLTTRRPDSTALRAAYTNASFGTHRLGTTLTYKRLALLDAEMVSSDGDYPFSYHSESEDTTGKRRNDSFRAVRLEANMFLGNDGRGGAWRNGTLQWHTYFYASRRGLPGAIVRRLSNRYTDVGREWDRNFFSQLSYRKAFGAVSLRAIAKYANDHLHYSTDYPENMGVHADVRYRQQDIYGAVAGAWQWRALNVSLSTDLRWSDVNSDRARFYYVYRLDSKTSLTVTFRHRGTQLSATGLFSTCRDHTHRSADPMNRWTWNVVAAQTVGRWTFRAFHKSAFRVPTLNDLYYTLVGNRRLKPEMTRQLDIGVAYSAPWLNVQLDAYSNHITDRIVCLPLRSAFEWTMLNYGRTRSLGVNLTANAHWRIHSLTLSAAYQDDRNRTNPEGKDYNDYIPYSPRWTFSAVYAVSWHGFNASVSHMFVDKRYWMSQNSLEEPLDRYRCTDLKAGYTHRWWTVEAECQNLFDESYEIIQRWPMPGRRFAVTLTVAI